MFSVREKRFIAEKIQEIIRSTNHPELPEGEIEFDIHIKGKEDWSWANIKNNGSVKVPGVNPWNEHQDKNYPGDIEQDIRDHQFDSNFDVEIKDMVY